ncbi:MAG: hypothetical protein ACRYG4_00365 [Janthinobacterium lividum]
MASPDRVLAVDLYGSALVFEAFGTVIAPGGAGLIISSMAGHVPVIAINRKAALAWGKPLLSANTFAQLGLFEVGLACFYASLCKIPC